MNEHNQRQEIIIIKRGGEEEDAHHGGAWKIAFADFMTAMMALFLVLWLVNAANEETKKAVASYFNPVKLVDRNQSKKGLDEQKGGPNEGEETGGAPVVISETKEKATENSPSEEEFFRDPFTALSNIAAGESAKHSQRLEGAENGSALSGEADPFPDPFDDAQQNAPAPSTLSDAPRAADSAGTIEAKLDKKPADRMEEQPSPEPGMPKPEPEKDLTSLVGQGVEVLAEPAAPVKASDKEEARLEPVNAKDERKEKIEELSKSIMKDIKKEIGLTFDNPGQMDAALTVIPVEEGVLISVTDILNYPMFEIGSAVPRGPIVVAMEKIAHVIQKRGGPMRVYGHTDARPYRDPLANNWQLSSSRALAAYYMLIRAGLDEKRVTQITGFADRELKVAADPNADVNRRIELLLEVQ